MEIKFSLHGCHRMNGMSRASHRSFGIARRRVAAVHAAEVSWDRYIPRRILILPHAGASASAVIDQGALPDVRFPSA
ncbi:protein of unknown function [Burkholderia multivorans]